MQDYIIVTSDKEIDDDDDEYCPEKIKIINKKNWKNSLVIILPSQRNFLTIENLIPKIFDNYLLSFKYLNFTINDTTECLYFKYLKTLDDDDDDDDDDYDNENKKNNDDDGDDDKDEIWPRQLFVFLKYEKNKKCLKCFSNQKQQQQQQVWQVYLRKKMIKKYFCTKCIPWDKVYITMGNEIKSMHLLSSLPSPLSSSKPPPVKRRKCPVCRQCFKCKRLKNNNLCRKHKICKHYEMKNYIYNEEDKKNLTNFNLKIYKKLNGKKFV